MLLDSVLVFVLFIVSVTPAKHNHNHNHHQQHHHHLYDQYDALFVARCDAKCFGSKTNKNQCIKACLLKGGDKPGKCSNRAEDLSAFAAVCLKECQQDTQCPGLDKCCHHHCGVTCQRPKELQYATGLSRIPTELTVSEHRRGRAIQIRWRPGEPSSPTHPILYVLEERHHTGRLFIENRLGAWSPCSRSSRSSVVLKNLVKPGRWYQFRVAAVNENGTLGYSETSNEFITSLGPRPPAAPPNMTVGPLWSSNGSLWAELKWSAPSSDLPIQRYKVFWSKRLQGATALDSVLVRHRTVNKDQTKFLLRSLQPNSLYFLQVQAFAQFGKERLKSEKSALVLNTTNYENATTTGKPPSLAETKDFKRNLWQIENFHLQKIYWNRGGLKAKIAWKFPRAGPRYTVSWWSSSCQDYKPGHSHLKLAATTKNTNFALYNLQFKCKYRISVVGREILPDGVKITNEPILTIKTPSCAHIAARTKKDKPKCNSVNSLSSVQGSS